MVIEDELFGLLIVNKFLDLLLRFVCIEFIVLDILNICEHCGVLSHLFTDDHPLEVNVAVFDGNCPTDFFNIALCLYVFLLISLNDLLNDLILIPV